MPPKARKPRKKPDPKSSSSDEEIVPEVSFTADLPPEVVKEAELPKPPKPEKVEDPEKHEKPREARPSYPSYPSKKRFHKKRSVADFSYDEARVVGTKESKMDDLSLSDILRYLIARGHKEENPPIKHGCIKLLKRLYGEPFHPYQPRHRGDEDSPHPPEGEGKPYHPRFRRRDGGQRDGGRRDGGQRDGGQRDGGRREGVRNSRFLHQDQ